MNDKGLQKPLILKKKKKKRSEIAIGANIIKLFTHKEEFINDVTQI